MVASCAPGNIVPDFLVDQQKLRVLLRLLRPVNQSNNERVRFFVLYVLKRLWKDGLGTTDDLNGLQEKLPRLIRKTFGRLLHIRHPDSGSPNDCEWETTALLNPVYNALRFGIDFVASPRHSDMLLVTGGTTRKLEEAVRKTYAAAPDPKLVVAIGDDACGSGFVGRNYAHYGVWTGSSPSMYSSRRGDPPTPTAILHGIFEAVDLAY